MSEAELHVLRARLRGGILSKARRGDLEMRLPIGFVADATGHARLDPDRRIQETIRLLFRTFGATGSATATVKAFREQGHLFPRRVYRGPQKGEVIWGELEHSRILWILHHPRYTGAFCFGRSRQRKRLDGGVHSQRLPREEWLAFLPDAHEGYITWVEYETNLQRLRENMLAFGGDRRRGPPREGPALLQGLTICGVCGDRMTVRYHTVRGRRIPTYVCQRRGIQRGEPLCQAVHGGGIDRAIGQLLLDSVTPVTIEVALAVQGELEKRGEEADRLRHHEVEQARYATELARRRYMHVDPSHRMVADALEADWNTKLREQVDAEERYEKRSAESKAIGASQRAELMALATDFPRVWNDPRTPDKERKRMARLLLEDVTIMKDGKISLGVRFRGGATTVLTLPKPMPSWLLRQTPESVVTAIDRLLEHHTDAGVAERLNAQGLTSGGGWRFHRSMVRRIREGYGLKSRYQRLRELGLLEESEIATLLDVCTATIKTWRRAGLLTALAYDDKGSCLYQRPDDSAPQKHKHQNKMRGRNTTHGRKLHRNA